MITLFKKNIKPINFIDAVYCELIDEEGFVLASFKALKFSKRLQIINGTIIKNKNIDVYDYIK